MVEELPEYRAPLSPATQVAQITTALGPIHSQCQSAKVTVVASSHTAQAEGASFNMLSLTPHVITGAVALEIHT